MRRKLLLSQKKPQDALLCACITTIKSPCGYRAPKSVFSKGMGMGYQPNLTVCFFGSNGMFVHGIRGFCFFFFVVCCNSLLLTSWIYPIAIALLVSDIRLFKKEEKFTFKLINAHWHPKSVPSRVLTLTVLSENFVISHYEEIRDYALNGCSRIGFKPDLFIYLSRRSYEFFLLIPAIWAARSGAICNIHDMDLHRGDSHCWESYLRASSLLKSN